MEKQLIIIPTNCPTCDALLVRNGPFLECSNSYCREVKIHQIMKWISKLDIMHLSRKTLDKLMEVGFVSKISDLYKLTLNQVQGIPGIGQGFQRILDELVRSKDPDLPKFLAAFDMDGIGERIIRPICETHNIWDLNSMFGITLQQLLEVPGISEIRALSFLENLADMGEELIETANIVGISVPMKTTPIQGSLTGKSFCFTGALNTMKRNEAEALVAKNGGSISSVKKGLTYLVTNDANSGSSKNEKAASLGITLIDETQFLSLLK